MKIHKRDKRDYALLDDKPSTQRYRCVTRKKMRCAQNTRELPVTEEGFDLNNNHEVFCHWQMTMKYCFIFTSYEAYGE